MSSVSERLEKNLKAKIEILERIYESDRRLLESFDIESARLEQYDEYLAEQDSYMSNLDDLDLEYDEIVKQLSAAPALARQIPADRKRSINTLIMEIDGKVQAVSDIERRVKTLTEKYFENRRSAIAGSKKTARMIQSRYGSNSMIGSGQDSMFDISN